MVDISDWLRKAASINKAAREELLARIEWTDPRIRTENRGVVGRMALVGHLSDIRQANSQTPIVLWGRGGVGKTAAADYVARQLVGEGAYQGAWRISGETITAASQDLSPLGMRLGVEEKENDEAYFRACLDAMSAKATGQKGWLLIHDNVDDEDTQRALLKRLNPVMGVDHLITSRLKNWSKTATAVHIEEPDEDAAVELLAREAGQEPSADLRALAVERLERLPLALMIAGSVMREAGLTAAEYGPSFETMLKRAPSGEMAYEMSLFGAVMESYGRLSDDGQAMLRLAAFMDAEDIDPEYLKKGEDGLAEGTVFHALAGDVVRRKTALAEAQKHSLLRDGEVKGDATRKVHRLTQAVLRDAMTPEEWQSALAGAAAAGRAQVTSQVQYDTKSWPRYRRLFAHARALIPFLEEAQGEGQRDGASFIHSASLFLRYSTGDLGAARMIYERNLPVVEAAYGAVSQNHAAALGGLGDVLDELAQATPAGAERAKMEAAAEEHLTRALEVTRAAMGARDANVAFDENALGYFFSVRGRFAEAELHYLRALEIRNEVGAALELIGTSHGNLGALYGRWAETLDGAAAQEMWAKEEHHKEEGLRRTREGLGELHHSTATRLHNLSMTRWRQGNRAAARRLEVRVAAVPLAMAVGDPDLAEHPEIVENVGLLAQLLSALGETADALEVAMADVEAALADHGAWERGETPDWPS